MMPVLVAGNNINCLHVDVHRVSDAYHVILYLPKTSGHLQRGMRCGGAGAVHTQQRYFRICCPIWRPHPHRDFGVGLVHAFVLL